MNDEKISSLRQRMIEDMTIRGIGEKAQAAHIRGAKHLATFLGRGAGAICLNRLSNAATRLRSRGNVRAPQEFSK